MFRFVCGGNVNPHRAAHVEVGTPQLDDLAGPHPAENLQFDHRSKHWMEMGERFLEHIVGNRADRFIVFRVGPTLAETEDRSDSVIDSRWDELVLGRPPKDPSYDSGEPVASRASDSLIDPSVPDRFQSERAKIAGRSVAIKLLQSADRPLDVVNFAGRLFELAVITDCPLKVAETEFRDREIIRVISRSMSALATTQEPLGDEPIVFGSTIR
jgi:hypothetical protein